MAESLPVWENTQINHLYHIVEFELQKTQDQIIETKKDTTTFFILLVALLGLLTFFTYDLFLYEGFFFCLMFSIGISVTLLIMSYFYIKADNELFSKSPFVALCLFWGIDLEKFFNVFKKQKRDMTFSFLSIFIKLNVFFLSITVITYIASVIIIPPNSVALYTINWGFILFLIFQIIFSLIMFINFNSLKKQEQTFSYLQFAWPIFFFAIISIIFVLYGFNSHQPPFTAIKESNLFSPLLIEHSIEYNQFFLTLGTATFMIIIAYVCVDFFSYGITSDRLNEKIEKLNELKSKLDMYFLKKIPDPNFNSIFEEYLITKFCTPRIANLWGIIWYILPMQLLSFDEMQELINYLVPKPDFITEDKK